MATVYVSNNPCVKNAVGGFSFEIALFDSDGIAVSSPTIATGDFKLAGDGGTPANITAPTADGTSVTVVLTQAQTNYDRIFMPWVDVAGDEWVSGGAYIATVSAVTVSSFAPATDTITESYSTDGGAITYDQALTEINQFHDERNIGAFDDDGEATMTIKKRDGSTAAKTLTVTGDGITRAS